MLKDRLRAGSFEIRPQVKYEGGQGGTGFQVPLLGTISSCCRKFDGKAVVLSKRPWRRESHWLGRGIGGVDIGSFGYFGSSLRKYCLFCVSSSVEIIPTDIFISKVSILRGYLCFREGICGGGVCFR